MAKLTTLTRAKKKDIELWKIYIPERESSEIFGTGVAALIGIKKTGQFIYGKKNWDNVYGRKKNKKDVDK